jgi:hypothetical protein
MFSPHAPIARWRLYRLNLLWAQTCARHTWGIRHIRAHLSHVAGKVLSTHKRSRHNVTSAC